MGRECGHAGTVRVVHTLMCAVKDRLLSAIFVLFTTKIPDDLLCQWT